MVDFDQKWNRFLLVELPDLLNFFENVSNQSFEWTSKFILISHQIIYEREGTNNLSWFEINPMHVRINSKNCISHFLVIFWQNFESYWPKMAKSKIKYLDGSHFCKKHIIWTNSKNCSLRRCIEKSWLWSKFVLNFFVQKSTENGYF